MKLQELKDKVIAAVKGFSIDKAMEFVKRNIRYLTAGALLLILVVVLATFKNHKPAGEGDSESEIPSEASIDEEYQEDAIPAVNELIKNYYTAYAAGDITSLQGYAIPISANEQSYIKMFSEFVDSYENLKCYTKQGLDNTSYLVSVYLEMKFKDIETTAPGLDFFYIRTNEEGVLYIDNLYSQFNFSNKEEELDEQVSELIEDFEQQEDVINLQASVQNQYEIALASDEKLAELINNTMAQALLAWKQSIQSAENSTENTTEQSTEPTSEQTTEQPPASEEPASEKVSTKETVYTTAIVNIRKKANETADIIDTVPAGTKMTRTGTTKDGWSKVKYKGKKAYVKSSFLSTEKPKTDDTSDNTSAKVIPEGTKVLLSATVNIRASMSETAEKVGTAFAGETVTVILSYAEGWTKVTWNDTTGYIKTDLLK